MVQESHVAQLVALYETWHTGTAAHVIENSLHHSLRPHSVVHFSQL